MFALLIWPVAILIKAVTGAAEFVAHRVKKCNKNNDDNVDHDKDEKAEELLKENETLEESKEEIREIAGAMEAKKEEVKSNIEDIKKAIVSEREKTKALRKKILCMKIQNRAATRSGFKFEKEEERRWKEALRL